jgi:putative Mn2+ efflux pump MntP
VRHAPVEDQQFAVLGVGEAVNLFSGGSIMATPLAWLGLVLGIDSLVVGFGLGAAVPQRRRAWLVLAFALCDGLASWLGWALGAQAWRSSLEWCEWLGPAAVAGYGVYVLGLAWGGRRLAEAGRGSGLVFALPLALSLDNLAAGVGAAPSAAWAAAAAIALGAISGCLALLGLRLGAALTARLPLRAEWLGGTVLVGTAVALLCKDLLS